MLQIGETGLLFKLTQTSCHERTSQLPAAITTITHFL